MCLIIGLDNLYENNWIFEFERDTDMTKNEAKQMKRLA